MIEVIIIIAVVKAFRSVADNKGRSKTAWAFVGALSYYGPILLMSFLLLPVMVQSGWITFITQDNYFLVSILINLATGITCCVVAYLFLKSLPDATDTDTHRVSHGDRQPVDASDDNPYSSGT